MLREEFINVGVLLVYPAANYQAVRSLPSFGTHSKVKAFEGSDGRFVRHAVSKLKDAVEGRQLTRFIGEDAAPEGLLTPSGLAALSASYHNNIQLSEPRSILTAQPEEALEELFEQFVAAPEQTQQEIMSKNAFQEFTQMGQDAEKNQTAETVETSQLAAEAFLDETW